MSKLIILRGPSGSGKTTVAGKLFEQTVEPSVLIGQDYYRFIFKPAGGTKNSKSIHKMIKSNVLAALEDNYDVILEGIFTKKSYEQIFNDIFSVHKSDNYIFTFAISFDETIRRHRTKPNRYEWSETDMKNWYSSSGLMGYGFEHLIQETSSVVDSVNHIKAMANV